MATVNPSADTTALGSSQAQNVATLRLAVLTAAPILMLLGGVKLVTSVLMILSATLVSLLGLVQGAIIVLLGLILIKIATDLRFAREVPQLAGLHFTNALDSWRDFCKNLIAVAVIQFLIAWARSA